MKREHQTKEEETMKTDKSAREPGEIYSDEIAEYFESASEATCAAKNMFARAHVELQVVAFRSGRYVVAETAVAQREHGADLADGFAKLLLTVTE
jgi:hypothetical protein